MTHSSNLPDDNMDVHKLWHSLIDACELRSNKLSGFNLMKRISEFAKSHPDIIETTCDDSMHMGSSIFLVPHKSDVSFMGHTMLFIGQDGQFCELFLYPHHAKELLEALKRIVKDA